MPNTFLWPVTSDKTINFQEALAINTATAMNNLPGVQAQGSRHFLIRSILVETKENYGPEINFFGSAAGFTADPATDTFIARFGFVSTMGEQIGGSGLWRYYIDGLAIPYVDLDTVGLTAQPTLHVILQNISATAKSAGVAGQSRVTVTLEEQQSY